MTEEVAGGPVEGQRTSPVQGDQSPALDDTMARGSYRLGCYLQGMSEKYVRVVSTEAVPGENRPIVASTVIWSGKHREITDAVTDLRKYGRKNNWDDIVGMRIVPTQEIYNAGGRDVNSFPGLIISYIVYGTFVRYRADD